MELRFYKFDKLFLTVKDNGEIELGKGIDVSKASKLFWQEIGASNPLLNKIEKQQKEIESLKKELQYLKLNSIKAA